MVKDRPDLEFVMVELWDGFAARTSFRLSSSRVTA